MVAKRTFRLGENAKISGALYRASGEAEGRNELQLLIMSLAAKQFGPKAFFLTLHRFFDEIYLGFPSIGLVNGQLK